MFSKPLKRRRRAKNKQKRVFKSEPEVLPCIELNYKFLERHKKPFSLVATRKQENPVNTAQKMASKSLTKQDGEATIHVFTFQGTYLVVIATLNFQCFRLDTSFLSVSNKWFGNWIAVFFSLLFLFNYAIQGKSITWPVNSALNCAWKPILHSSLRDSCDIGFCVQFNAQFPRQVMNFPIYLACVSVSGYGCTREVWRARKMRKSCSRRSREEL